MAVKKVYTFDPTRLTYIGLDGEEPATAGYGDLFYAMDLRQSKIFSSTGGWVTWKSFYTT